MSSSATTPLWGPQLPRIPRKRERRSYTQLKQGGTQVTVGYPPKPGPWTFSTVRNIYPNVERVEDTIRNPKFESLKPAGFKPADDGGPLKITKSHWEFSDSGNGILTPWRYGSRQLYGICVRLDYSLDEGFNMLGAYPPTSDTDVSQFHAKAYSTMKPNNPIVDLFTFVAEIRDLAHLNFSSIRSIKDIGNNWLAFQFGWKPLLSDIRKMVKAIFQIDSMLQNLIRNNGLPIRRRAKVFNDSTSKVLSSANTIGINRNTWVDWPDRTNRYPSARYEIKRSLQTEVWASSSFIFYLKDIELPSVKQRLKLGLLGMNPTPASVWNALPWSWLIDWLTNIGDILNNMSSIAGERLVAQYFYVMGRTLRTYEWFGTDGYYDCSAKHIFESKVREVGHPYGLAFGSNLTTLQFSILAALASQRF